jgi:hypothetical protein
LAVLASRPSASPPSKHAPISIRWSNGCNRHRRRKPLIALAQIDGLGWLPVLFNSVVVRVASNGLCETALPDLDESEAASIRLALASVPRVLL